MVEKTADEMTGDKQVYDKSESDTLDDRDVG